MPCNWILDTGFWILDTGYWILDVWELGIGNWELTATAFATCHTSTGLQAVRQALYNNAVSRKFYLLYLPQTY